MFGETNDVEAAPAETEIEASGEAHSSEPSTADTMQKLSAMQSTELGRDHIAVAGMQKDKQVEEKRETAEPGEDKQLAAAIQKHPGQADAYRVAMAGAPDYHGFLDDLRPGAIRQVRSALEAVGSPFGAGKGSMSVKKLMESLAHSPHTKERTKETSTGAVQYMLNGNRVPKAAYKYYQHLKSIGYGKEQETDTKAEEALAPGYRTESGKPLSRLARGSLS